MLQILPLPSQYNTQLIHFTTNSNLSSPDSFASLMRDNLKQKSQLCRGFIEAGFCPYQNRCKFAHGSH